MATTTGCTSSISTNRGTLGETCRTRSNRSWFWAASASKTQVGRPPGRGSLTLSGRISMTRSPRVSSSTRLNSSHLTEKGRSAATAWTVGLIWRPMASSWTLRCRLRAPCRYLGGTSTSSTPASIRAVTGAHNAGHAIAVERLSGLAAVQRTVLRVLEESKNWRDGK